MARVRTGDGMCRRGRGPGAGVLGRAAAVLALVGATATVPATAAAGFAQGSGAQPPPETASPLAEGATTPAAATVEATRRAALAAAHAAQAAAEPAAETPAIDEAGDDLELELDQQPVSFPDPLENLNRRTLRFNQTVDRWVISPVARAYGNVVPDPAKRSVRQFFANLESPAVFVNDVLQGEMGAAATTVARFSVNTIVGIGGLFDPASSLGLPGHESDFGETLARNGVGSGPFLIVPLLGPTTVREGIGSLVDVALQPSIYLLGPAPLVAATVQEGTHGLTLREVHGEDLARLQQASLDYYAALRSAYYQDRMATLEGVPAAAPETVAEGAEGTSEGAASAEPAFADPELVAAR